MIIRPKEKMRGFAKNKKQCLFCLNQRVHSRADHYAELKAYENMKNQNYLTATAYQGKQTKVEKLAISLNSDKYEIEYRDIYNFAYQKGQADLLRELLEEINPHYPSFSHAISSVYKQGYCDGRVDVKDLIQSKLTSLSSEKTAVGEMKYAICNFGKNIHPDDKKALDEFIAYRRKRNKKKKEQSTNGKS